MSVAQREFGDGVLGRISASAYTLLAVELMFLVTSAPGLVALTLLDRDASNLPLVALCAVPLGPAVSAALFALHHRRADLTDLRPVAAFWRGYRLNLRPSLPLWVGWLAWLTVISVTLANFGAAGVPRWWAGLLVVVAVAVTLWQANAVVIVSLFSFRAGDTARLAAYFLARTPGATLANLALVIVAVGVVLISSEVVLALLGSLLAMSLLRNARPMITAIREEFTA